MKSYKQELLLNNNIMRVLQIGFYSVLLFLFSCSNNNDGFSKTTSGFYYKIFSGNLKKDSIKKNYIAKIQLQQFIDDSLLSGPDVLPQYVKITDSVQKFDFPEILPLMCVQDSAICKFATKDIIKKSVKATQIPPFLTKGKNIIVKIKVLQQFNNDSVAQQDFEKEKTAYEAIKAVRDKAGMAKAQVRFDSLCKTLPSTTQKLTNGVMVSVVEKGSDKKIITDNEINVYYKGFLDNGDFFEATPFDKPYEMQIGQNESIEGFETGVASLHIGDSAHIYVPATLAYGTNAAGDKIPRYSNLVFKVRVLAKNLNVTKHDR